MNNSKLSKAAKVAATKFIIIYLAVFLAMPVQALERIRYIHTDILGSPTAATDVNGDVVWREYYRPYGERIVDATDENRVWFAGKLEQSSIGLNYNSARWYDPMVGRFTGVDPVGVDPGDFNTFNRYCYANNNPYRYVDPDGRFFQLAEAALIGLVIFAAISIYAESKRATINTFPASQGGYGNYGGQILDSPSGWSTTSPISEWNVPTWVSSESSDVEYGEDDWNDAVWEDGTPHTPLPDDYFGDNTTDSGNDSSAGSGTTSAEDNSYSNKPGHKKNKTKNNEGRHQKGDSRRKMDRGNEKGDARRYRYR